MSYHLFQKFFGKMVEIKKMSFLSTRGMILIFRNCNKTKSGLKHEHKNLERKAKRYFVHSKVAKIAKNQKIFESRRRCL